MYTMFSDMHSGGGTKEQWESIIVNLPEEEAVDWFEEEFGHHPYDIACDCCGENYAIREYETQEDAEKCILFEKDSHKYFEV